MTGGALFAAMLLAGCAGSAPAQPTEVSAPGFDVAAVRESFEQECESPIVVDELFCEQVVIDGMTAEGTILRVPTLLNAQAHDRASAICEQLAMAHFDGEGADLGYKAIGVLDRDGGNAAACTVSP